jgi:hypothetical protein
VSIRPTRIIVLLFLFALATLGSWFAVGLMEGYGTALPGIPWSTALVLGFFALALLLVTQDMKKRIEQPDQKRSKELPEKPKTVNPLHAARMVILAKASSHGGALIAGLYLGFALYLLPDFDSNQRRARMVVAAATALMGLVVALVGLLLERMLRLPEE